MDSQRLSFANAFASVHSAPDGLSSSEAARRLAELGPNRFEKVAGTPAWQRLIREFFQFFSVILWIAAALSFFAELNDPDQGMPQIGIAIIIVILVNGLFSFWQQFRAERTLAALQELLPQKVRVLRDGDTIEIDVHHIVVGDVILLDQGATIPADCWLMEGFGVRVNTATLTGEAMPQPRRAVPPSIAEPNHGANVLFAGTSLVSGHGKAIVFATGADTEFGKIAHLSQSSTETASPLRIQLARFSRLIAILSIALAIIFLSIGNWVGIPFWQNFILSIGIIVAMVPEGLLTTLTMALVLAGNRMAKKNVLIRHLTAVEGLGSTTVICTDKTGTLTQNRMRAQKLFVDDEIVSAATTAHRLSREFLFTAHFCNDVQPAAHRTTQLSGDPTDVALAEMASQSGCHFPESRRLDEIPFDSDRMRQSVVQDIGGQAILYCKGAPESVLPLCSHHFREGEICELREDERAKIAVAQDQMAEDGLRVLAFACRGVQGTADHEDLERDLVFVGLVGLEDPPRAEAAGAIQKCREAGIKVIVVTGDHPHTAIAVAREIDLVRSSDVLVITGEQLTRLSAGELQLALDAPEIVFARVAADQKMRIVEALKHKKHIVAVTGDGVNDAPALKAAHVGIAMGIAGTDVAREAADIVLLDDNFASVVAAVEEGRAVFLNIRKFLTYLLTHNVAQLVPFLAYALLPIPLPITPLQVLFVDMISDSLTALGLGAERPTQRVLRVPPRPASDPLMDGALALRAYLFLGLIEAAVVMAAFFAVLLQAGWQLGDIVAVDDPLYRRATTASVSAIIVLQIMNVYLCRSPRRSMFTTGISGNALIAWGVVVEIVCVLAINYMPLAREVLDTEPLTATVWLLIAIGAALLAALEEGRKWIMRKYASRGL